MNTTSISEPSLQQGQVRSLELPDNRHMELFPDGRLVIVRLWHPGTSPIDFLQHLSSEETKLLERLLAYYPRICPLAEVCAPHLRTRIAKGRLYYIVSTLRLKLTGSGLVPVPVTGEGYVLALSSAPRTVVPLIEGWLGEDLGLTLAPKAELAVLWQQGCLQRFQRFSRFQMRLLESMVQEFPHYCSYERLVAASKNIPYDPALMARWLEQQPHQKDLLHSAMFLIKERLRMLGLCLENYEDIGYQLRVNSALRCDHSA